MTINARRVEVHGEEIFISTRFRKFVIERSEIASFKVQRIPSFFDEIGIELQCDKYFLVTERADGFLDLAKFLCLDKLFGQLWYRDAENGRILEGTGENQGSN
jgi:hypothetical protein